MINYVELIKNLIMPLVIYEDQVSVESEILSDGTINVNVNVDFPHRENLSFNFFPLSSPTHLHVGEVLSSVVP